MLPFLAAASDLWLKRDSAFRAHALDALQVSTGHSLPQLNAAIDAAFSELTAPVLEKYCQENKLTSGHAHSHSRIVLHIAAGNVFTAWLHGAAITLLMGHRCWIKPSSMERVFAPLWQDSLRRVDPVLADEVKVVDWNESLPQEVDAVVAYGRNETLKILRSKFPKTLFIGYGHKWSFAIVFKEALSKKEWLAWRDRLQQDAQAFSLQGCLSPQRLFIQGDADTWRQEIATLSTPAPTVQAFTHLNEIPALLKNSIDDVSCIGIAGESNRFEEIRRIFGESPRLRVCTLGRMQCPPLSWRNAGISLMENLRFSEDI